MRKQAGLSLSELLISLFLSTLIITPLIQLYVSSKQRYNQVEKILEAQFDLQWVSDLLKNSIRRAGFTPCLGIEHLQVVDHRNHQTEISALQIGNKEEQFIQVNRMEEHFAKIVKIQDRKQIFVKEYLIVHKKRPVLIADCEHAEILELTNINRSPENSLITLNKPLFFSYDKSAYIGEYLEEKWLIKKNINHVDSLYYQLGRAEEITPLVHSIDARNEQGLVELVLNLDEGKTQSMKVFVRGL